MKHWLVVAFLAFNVAPAHAQDWLLNREHELRCLSGDAYQVSERLLSRIRDSAHSTMALFCARPRRGCCRCV